MAPLAEIELDLADLASGTARTAPGAGSYGTHAATRAAIDDGWTGCLLHGFGASANDLMGLAPELGRARHWIFPHAPAPITVAGMSYGRAWFPRDEGELEQALYGGYFGNLRHLEPQGLRDAASEVRELLTLRDVNWSRLILGGFSQGAMVTAEILRQSLADPSLPMPAVAILFSGALTAAGWWRGLSRDGSGAAAEGAGGAPVEGPDGTAVEGAGDTPVDGPGTLAGPAAPRAPLIFQSHGDVDPILPMEEGEALRDTLTAAGFAVEWLPFHGRHEIPRAAMAAARALIARG
jgi:phospholipase/carboxylesterase